ncbi:MAG: hypothetical protein IH945_04835 [Armatimonadetes bacterium]|nr:hypothetical protein [Armatimonadota bacterium]
MKRAFALAALTTAASPLLAQTPEVALFADLRPSWFMERGQISRIRWYDPHGRYSVLGFHIVLETGNRVKITQRLEKIDNDGDPDNLDEYYVESRGTWRIGKQYLPFGQQNILRETTPALRYDTELLFDAAPIKIAVGDNGRNLTRGIFARVGDEVGVSFAIGNHIGIQGTALTQFQRPESAPGRGRGHQKAYGFDASYPLAGGTVEAEWVSLRDGDTPQDVDRDLSDLRYRFTTRKTNYVVTVAWSRSWERQTDWYRVYAEIPISRKVVWEPFVRFRGFGWQDFGLTARIRL